MRSELGFFVRLILGFNDGAANLRTLVSYACAQLGCAGALITTNALQIHTWNAVVVLVCAEL